jgi:hypothetical protein
LIGVLADALGDAVTGTEAQTPAATPVRPSVISTLRNWFRPKLAQITELRVVRNPSLDNTERD